MQKIPGQINELGESGTPQPTTLLILIYKNIYLTLFSIILCVNTFYQRYNYRNHTLAQIIIGALIGIIFALLSSYKEADNIVPP